MLRSENPTVCKIDAPINRYTGGTFALPAIAAVNTEPTGKRTANGRRRILACSAERRLIIWKRRGICTMAVVSGAPVRKTQLQSG
jgi:hypothetical protein